MRLLSQPGMRLAAILLIALIIRTIGISTRPIWYDEAFSVLFSEKGPAAMLQGTLTPTSGGAAEEHPLGYYLILWLWTRLFGESLAAVRLLSIAAGLASVLVVYELARDLFNRQTALLASFFVAIFPFQVHYSQEIRMYSFLGLWLMLATLAYWKGRSSGRPGWWLLFAISAALAQYTHNLAAFYLAPLAASAILQRDKRTLKSTIAAGIGALLLYLPWLIQLPSQVAKIDQAYWVEKPAASRLLTLLLAFTTNLPIRGLWLVAGLFLTLLAVAIALYQTFKAARARPAGWENGLWILYLSFAPPVLLFLFSQWKPVYIERALIASSMMFCTWLAWSLLRTGAPRLISHVVTGLLLAAAAIGLYNHITYAGFPYGPYRQLDASLEGRLQPGDVILHASKATMLPSVYFDRSLPQDYLADPPESSIDTLADATQQVLGLIEISGMQTAARGRQRIWFVVFQTHIDRFIELGYETHPQLTWLNSHMHLQSIEEWGDLRLYLYTQ